MRSIVKRLAQRFYRPSKVILKTARILAQGQGQLASLQKQGCFDSAGNPLPWYTYPAIEYLKQFDVSQTDVFEFGSGNSSRFWASRARRIVSVEHDKEWADRVRGTLASNQQLLLREDKDGYLQALQESNGAFGVIIIDGNHRHACVRIAPARLADAGMIIFDNSDWFPVATKELRDQGFFQIDFSGFGPLNPYAWTTSVFIKHASSLQRNFSNPAPIGGIKNVTSPND